MEGPFDIPIGKHNITFLFGKWNSRRNYDTVKVHVRIPSPLSIHMIVSRLITSR